MGIISYFRDLFDDSEEGMVRRANARFTYLKSLIEAEREASVKPLRELIECIKLQEKLLQDITSNSPLRNAVGLWDPLLANRPHDLLDGKFPISVKAIRIALLDAVRYQVSLSTAIRNLRMALKSGAKIADAPFYTGT